jgi:LPS-assembly protein
VSAPGRSHPFRAAPVQPQPLPVISKPDQSLAEPLEEMPEASAAVSRRVWRRRTLRRRSGGHHDRRRRAPEQAAEQAVPVPATQAEAAAAPSATESARPQSAETEAGSQATFLSAQRISGVVDREVIAEDNAELRQLDKVLTADRMTYWPVDDEVEAVGSARFQQRDDVVSGTRMRMRLEDQFGFFDDASYFVKRPPRTRRRVRNLAARGHPTWRQPSSAAISQRFRGTTFLRRGARADQAQVSRWKTGTTEARGRRSASTSKARTRFVLSSATYTTCKPGNDDWYLSTAALHLDYDNEVGSGNDATVHFLGVPILYSPWFSFSLNNQRKSGFLTPSYGSSSDSGFEFTLPYYWNIAPNMDATFEPTLLTKRGLLLGTDFRYLNAAYGGTYVGNVRGEYLPNDRVADRDRWGVALTHSQSHGQRLFWRDQLQPGLGQRLLH